MARKYMIPAWWAVGHWHPTEGHATKAERDYLEFSLQELSSFLAKGVDVPDAISYINNCIDHVRAEPTHTPTGEAFNAVDTPD